MAVPWIIGAVWAVVAIWIAALVLIVLFAILRRHISLAGLLREPLSGAGAATRPQMLIFSLAALFGYAALALSSLGQAPTLPEADEWMLGALGGSHLLYLGGRGAVAAVPALLKLMGGGRDERSR